MKLQAYNLTLIAMTSMVLLALIQQFLGATAKVVFAKAPPGLPLKTGHDDFNFRAE